MSEPSHTIQIRVALSILEPFDRHVVKPNNATRSETIRQAMVSMTKDAIRFEQTYGPLTKESP